MFNKKVAFVFHTIFKVDFMTEIISCIIYRCLYCPFILCCFPMSVSKKRYIGRILILPDSYMWQKFNKMNEKRSLGYQSGGVEYVTGQINSRILQLFWDDFTVWFLHCLGNLNMLWSDKAFTQQPFISINTALSGSYKSLLSNL